MRVFFVVLAFLTTAYCLCKVNGKDYNENDKWRNDDFMVQCQRTETGWKRKVISCVVDGKEIPIGDKLKLGKILYVCEKTDNGVKLRYFWYFI